MPRHRGDDGVAGSLRLPVDTQRRERLVLGVQLAGAVEHVVRGDVHQRGAVLGGDAGQLGDARHVDRPGGPPALRSLCGIHRSERRGVENRADLRPGHPVKVVRPGHVEFGILQGDGVGKALHQGPPELAVGADDDRASGRHRCHVCEQRMVPVGLGDLGLVERDRPADRELRVGQVDEGVGRLGLRAPVLVDQVGIGRAWFQGLVAVGDPARHEHRRLRAQLQAHDGAEGGTGSQVDPGAEHPPGQHRNQLVPGLGVHAPGHPGRRVERDVVLHRPEVWQAERGHLGALPVLLEPAAGVSVHGQVQHQQAGDRGLAHRQLSHGHCPCAA